MVPVHLFGAGAQNMTSSPAEYDILREIWVNICYNLGRSKAESQEQRIAAGAIRKRGTGSCGTAERVAVQAALSGKSPDEALDGDRGIAVHRDSFKSCFFWHRCVGTGCRSREAAAMRASDGTFLFWFLARCWGQSEKKRMRWTISAHRIRFERSFIPA